MRGWVPRSVPTRTVRCIDETRMQPLLPASHRAARRQRYRLVLRIFPCFHVPMSTCDGHLGAFHACRRWQRQRSNASGAPGAPPTLRRRRRPPRRARKAKVGHSVRREGDPSPEKALHSHLSTLLVSSACMAHPSSHPIAGSSTHSWRIVPAQDPGRAPGLPLLMARAIPDC